MIPAAFLPGRGIQFIFHWCTLSDSFPRSFFMLKVDKIVLNNEKEWYVVANSLGYIFYGEIILL